ncbi:bifunctional 3-phosphoshikimate 1-carboxyvinyltransferase/cytidylate kinase [Piscinibacter sakaiensis]|uniref:Multifunctional fusion protein n=1 Tax=Piscinibacter sakaiensis TaxID=1547922 RepID=A0A0K8NTC2_PISS1|nr:bifunctional 3-phosphoshikimate 1-carboxyvinyltransferase/cytidylate kinase [Piscinibacter sakaiensis]GAP33613.1 5-enolpyruvylshikimate-3-phosphate synthase/cytidylate kinase [Piscinibacter sakaiensis]
MFDTAFLDLPPLERVAGSVRLPGSKSISNRVLLLAGLSEGQTTVRDLLASDDTRVMLDALRALGCGIDEAGDHVRITGLGGRLAVREAELFLGNAGTAMRPLTAALAVLAARDGGCFTLSGVARMHERPIGDLVEALRSLGCAIESLGQPGYPPLRLAGGRLAPAGGTAIRVRGDVSSQFLTALLLALPLASDGGARTIEVDGELISKPYVDITLNLLARFGIAVQREGWQRFTVPAGARYQSPGEIHVEGDASSASYFIAAGALAAVEAPLRIEGVGADSIQGDIRFVDAARAMGAEVEAGPGWLAVRRGAWPLRPIRLGCNEIPDAAMTLAVMALFADGPSRLDDIASWRVKETDRIAAMAAELRKLGADVVEGADHLEIHPPVRWQAASVRTYDDHRMAMCLSLAAFNPLRIGGEAAVPVRIQDPRCVGKTFPDYFEALFSVAGTSLRHVPVITIDGPTASGKGTLASAVAEALGYHFLDSGAVYRATALSALRAGLAPDDEAALAALARALPLAFRGRRILLDGEEVQEQLRREDVGLLASRIASLGAVRQALRQLQLDHRRVPGLVADGRDMGTVVFPQADLKVFLTASAATRAGRRHAQLLARGESANIDSLRLDLESRDERDRNRTHAPLRPAEDAVLLDNSALSVDETVAAVLKAWESRRRFG